MAGQDERRDLAALVVPQAGWLERADFSWWIQIAVKPGRAGGPGDAARAGAAAARAGVPNPVTGKAPPAHHYPMEPYRGERSGRYRPRLARRAPHHIPEEKFNELFATLGSHRDRALVAFWVSTGARASELLGLSRRDADPMSSGPACRGC